MKTRLLSQKHINAFFTKDVEQTARLMKEGEKVRVPEKIIKQASDIVSSVIENINNDKYEKYDRASIIAAYTLRYAYILNRDKKLIEASASIKRKMKTKIDWWRFLGKHSWF